MKIRKYFSATIVFLFLVVFYGYAEEPSEESGSGMMWNKLRLTSAQQEKIKVLHAEMGASKAQYATDMQNIRRKMAEELKKDKPSQSTLDQYAREVGKYNEKVTKDWNDHLLKIKEIFTPEQFKMMIQNYPVDGNSGVQGLGQGRGQGNGAGRGQGYGRGRRQGYGPNN